MAHTFSLRTASSPLPSSSSSSVSSSSSLSSSRSSSSGVAGVARRSRVSPATYRRRRGVAAAMVAVAVVTIGALAPTAITVVGAAVSDTLAGPGGVPASATGAQPAVERSVVVARPGDTLWSLAHQHRGTIDHGRFLDELVLLNGGATIEAGQRIVLP